MPKEIFAENHEYIIYNLSEEDKDNYFELQSQLTGGKWKTDEELRNALWNYLHNISRDNHFSVFSREKGYCGDLILKNPQSNTPEIGLDLLESMRNKGIAGKCIRLFASGFFKKNEGIEYILIKVKSSNIQSIRMIEKLGAERFMEEENLIDQSVRIMKELGHDQMSEMLKKKAEEYKKGEKEVIYCYKLTEEML